MAKAKKKPAKKAPAKKDPPKKAAAKKAPAKKAPAKKATAKPLSVKDAASAAVAALRSATDENARTSQAAFAKLQEISTLPLWEIPAKTGRPLFDGWIADFLAVVDERWLPILQLRASQAEKLDDDDPRVVYGVVAGMCKVLGDLKAILKAFPKSRRGKWSFIRELELARGIASLRSPDSLAHLLADIDPWIEAVNRREYGTTSFKGLLTLDIPETHERIARLLETANFNAHNWHHCADAVWAAKRLRSKAALPGLRRAVENGFRVAGHPTLLADTIAEIEAAT